MLFLHGTILHGCNSDLVSVPARGKWGKPSTHFTKLLIFATSIELVCIILREELRLINEKMKYWTVFTIVSLKLLFLGLIPLFLLSSLHNIQGVTPKVTFPSPFYKLRILDAIFHFLVCILISICISMILLIYRLIYN